MIRRTRSSRASPACARSAPQLGGQQGESLEGPGLGVGQLPLDHRGHRTGPAPRSDPAPATASASSSPSDADDCRPRREAGGSSARLPSSARSRGPIAQRGPVSSWSSSRVGGQVVQQGPGWRVPRTTSGRRSNPFRPTISTGISARGQRVEHISRVGVVADEYADLAPGGFRQLGVGVPDLCRQPRQLRGIRLVDDGLYVAPRQPSPPTSGSTCGKVAWSGAANRLATSRIRRSDLRLTVSGKLTDVSTAGAREVVAEVAGCWRPTHHASRRSPGWGRRRR